MTGTDPFRGDIDLWPRDALLAALAQQVDAGVFDTLEGAPIDRFAASDAAAEAARARADQRAPAAIKTPAKMMRAPEPEPAPKVAAGLAACAHDLPALLAAVQGFERCALREGAKSTVFADGLAGARVMIIGEAPGRDEDREGKPFVGRPGALLDQMMAAIGLSRGAADPAEAVYLTNLSPWRPLENRQPSAEEAAMLVPFLVRHIELARPEFLLLMGSGPWKALMQTDVGITRARGRWTRWRGIPLMPTFHPADLLRTPARKREAWLDLQRLRAALGGETPPNA
jgi:uracil-DNA glycosylase family 4